MQKRPCVICLEFNELTPRLVERFISQGHLPNFQRLRDQSLVHTSDAEAEGEWLNPWVQWVTVHSGLSVEEHGVYRLSNAYQLKTPAIWDLLSDEGFRVWICGSMNSWFQSNINGHVLPDAWSRNVPPYPAGEFDAFHNFVQRNVQEHAASKVPVSRSDELRFMSYLVRHGLKARTVFKIVRQLVKERLGNYRWQRASLLDDLQYDVFAWYFRRFQPQFSTFFLNSTAHYQHKFWRNMDPDAFQIKPTAAEQKYFQNAILFGYQQMDRIIGRVMRLAPQATIVLLSGLGQQPFTRMESTGGKRIFRIHNESVLRDRLGISGPFTYEPIMADEFFLRFETDAHAEAAVARLRSFELSNGCEAFTAELDGREIIGQCRCRELMPADAVITETGTNHTVPFADVFYRVDCVKSGFNHPDGLFWIRLPERVHHVIEQKVPLTNVAPTLLDLMGAAKPEFMRGESCLSQRPAASSGSEKVSVLATSC